MVALRLGDCLQLLKDIPDGSVDMVLCDLPYAVTDFSWDVIIPCDKLFAEYRRILKQNANIVLFYQKQFNTAIINRAFKTEFSHSLVWKKNNKTRAKSSKTVPLSSYEEIIVFRVNKVGNKSRHKRLREYFTGELAKCGYSVNELDVFIFF